MKKSILTALFLAIAILFPTIASGQTCQIKGTYDTVQVFSKNYNPASGILSVTVSSDSPSAANLQITVTTTYKYFNYSETRTYSENFLAQPNTSTLCEVRFPSSFSQDGREYKLDSYEITSLTGVKCETN